MERLESSTIPVPQAADLLNVHPSRVRAMIAQGRLEAQKVGGRWLVDRQAVESRRSRSPADGRPFSEANAWALICLSEGGEPDWVSKWELSRLRRRLREDGIEKLAPRLWKRALKKQLRAHPSLLPRLREDPRLFPSGVSVAAEHEIDIVAPNQFEAYVADEDLEEVMDDSNLEASRNPNVFLHVAHSDWIRGCADTAMGPAVAALDLFEADDEKSRRAGRELLAVLHSAWQGSDR